MKKIKADENYHRTVEPARSQIETREYYQTDDSHRRIAVNTTSPVLRRKGLVIWNIPSSL